MANNWKCRLLGAVFVSISTLCPIASGKGTDLQFRGTVIRINQISAGQGSINVRLMGFDLPVKVNTNTEIELAGDRVGLSWIKIGDFVKVSGFFTGSGIVAQDIDLLDDTRGEFRFRGTITAVGGSSTGKTITVLGVVVLLDEATLLERRGLSGGISASELAVGNQVDTTGTLRNGQLVATRVKAGNRDDDPVRVDFDGMIVSNQNSRLQIDTLGGGMAVVLMSGATQVKGTLAPGQMINVKGTLNTRLEVLADTITPQSDEEGIDDRRTGDVQVRREATLLPTVSGFDFSGRAELSYIQDAGIVQQQFNVQIMRGLTNNNYRILVDTASGEQLDFGLISTDSFGNASVTWSSNPKNGERDIRPVLLAGTDVRDFKKAHVAHPGGTIILLSGSF